MNEHNICKRLLDWMDYHYIIYSAKSSTGPLVRGIRRAGAKAREITAPGARAPRVTGAWPPPALLLLAEGLEPDGLQPGRMRRKS